MSKGGNHMENRKETIRKLAAEALDKNDGTFKKLRIHDEFNNIYADVCNLLHYCQMQGELDWVEKLTPIRDTMQEVIHRKN